MKTGHRLRPDLPPLPSRMKSLPVAESGYPVPWFVAWVENKPEFRVVARGKIELAVSKNLCWVCGKPLATEKAFVLGPMCALNRTNAEPPSHVNCAIFSAVACPFLTRPKAERRTDAMPSGTVAPAGMPIMRNPGCVAVWTTRSYSLFADGLGGRLFRVGDPVSVLWFAEGRMATYSEVLESITTGMPILEQAATEDGREALWELYAAKERLLPLLPTA
jgi:hypothetical protein